MIHVNKYEHFQMACNADFSPELKNGTAHLGRRDGIYSVIVVVSDILNRASCLRMRDLNNFLENLHQNEAEYNKRDDQSQEMEENNDYGLISSQELGALINQVANDVYNHNRGSNNKRHAQRNKDNKIGNLLKGADFFLSLRPQKVSKTPRQTLLDFQESIGSQNDKIYMVLNPQAHFTKKDFKDISKLISQILSTPRGNKIYSRHDPMTEERHYKGFVVRDETLARRRNRESKELYSPKDSLEDFKPKRGRGEYGGSGGRTPIPYIRHRDIYEKE